MMRRASLALLVFAISCGEEPAGPATEIVVYVDADPAVRGRANRLQVVVAGRAPGEPFFSDAEDGLFEIGPAELPFQFSFAPRDGDATRQWRVSVTGQDGGGTFVEKTARGVYVPDESRVLYMVLRGPCVDRSCASEQTCTLGSCVNDAWDPAELTVYAGGRVPPPDDPDPICTGDGQCGDDMFCNGDSRCDPSHPDADPQGCVSGTPPCPPPMGCDEGSDTCTSCGDGGDADSDGDNRPECGGADCDDDDPERYTGRMPLDNGIDDDCDGDSDEGFGECAVVPEDSNAACSDGCDNDADGFVDCDDRDCNLTVECGFCGGAPTTERTETACSDGCDNDGNGFIDCDDFHCSGIGPCTGAMDACGCGTAESCLSRRSYGFPRVCGEPCTVGEGTNPTDPATWDASQGSCPRGLSCWWRGLAGDRSGVCATGFESTMPPPPNIGATCTGDTECASPFGFGRCLQESTSGFRDNYCTVLDCAAPGVPPGLCGPNAACLRFANDSYCLAACGDTGDCRAGYRCVEKAGGPKVCMPECSETMPCGTFGTCVTSVDDIDHCEPSASL